ncbi:MAG: ATP synthase F0 subunit A [Phycisphaerae bacterium]|nr:ATP synthase F0 subunit A [Phycisphaerae bacterium]|tara:strand:+ start:3549 stop:4478 length:930 start_codon:yes stop_codon:yes gene_type:complete
MLPFLAASNPTHHVLDRPITGLEETFIFGTETLTIHLVTLTVAAIVAFLVLLRAAKSISTGDEGEGMYRYLTRGRVAQLIEVFTLFLVENTIRPTLKEETRKFVPFLLSLFFFILTCNLMGLIPFLDVQHAVGPAVEGQKVWAVFGGTATANLGVTFGLACVAFVAMQYQGFRSLGVKGYLSHLTGGAPMALLPMMVPLEIAGMLIKPAALAVRLFANMFAGHTMMAVLAMFGMMTWIGTEDYLVTGAISLVSIIASIAITFLELFVAFLQAFIFMFLTTVFIGQMTHHHEHDDHHEDAHGAAQPAGAH